MLCTLYVGFSGIYSVYENTFPSAIYVGWFIKTNVNCSRKSHAVSAETLFLVQFTLGNNGTYSFSLNISQYNYRLLSKTYVGFGKAYNACKTFCLVYFILVLMGHTVSVETR